MTAKVFDVETDNLNATLIHVLSYQGEDGVVSLTDYEEMRQWLLAQDILVGHNVVCFDIPTLERVLKIKIKAKLIDTLALSWYLWEKRNFHGLEWWGEELGHPKPKITDWATQPVAVYIHRCQEDVKINVKLWERQKRLLSHLYSVDEVENLPIISYLSFKMDCAREQERSKWLVDIPEATRVQNMLLAAKGEKETALRLVMPKVEKWSDQLYPAKPFKKDGTLSVQGAKWQKLVLDRGLKPDHTDPISVLRFEEEPNPSSPVQVKEWLFSLGWEPETFKEVAEEGGNTRQIPQIKVPNSPDLCQSIIRLIEEHPEVAPLEGLSVINSRLSVINGFIENADDQGFIKASIGGLTNTLRFKHRVFVNIPGVDKPFGKEIRGCLIARSGYELCGSDMISLESTTKRHYMSPYDPNYVAEMSVEGFDEHLDLAMHSGVITKDQYEAHVAGTENHSKVRKAYKVVNYSGVYGIGKAKLARSLKIKEKQAKELLDAYWKRNWAVKRVAQEQRVKTIEGQMWLYNPVSKFWYSLRADKDRFSTLNQGTGVYCFDCWVAAFRKKRPQLTAQSHDEIILEVKQGYRDNVTSLLRDAIDKVNDKLKLNVKLDIDIKHGSNYASIH